MNSKHHKTLTLIFKQPVPASLAWIDVENLLCALGAEMSEGAGSRLAFDLNEITLVVHRPHPRKEVDRGAVKSIRRFLETAGVKLT